jgi:hypothetical protein
LAFAVGIPLFQNPDEPSHVDRIRHQADHPTDLPDASLRMRRSVVKTSERVGLPLGFHQGWPSDLTERADLPSFSAGTGPDRPACASCQSYQYAHPPAYYLLLAPVSAVVEPLGADLHVLALRVAGVLLAAALPWLSWWLAVELSSGAVALAAAALAALNGPVVAATSAVNNDVLAFVASALVLAAAATVLRDGRTPARALLLGAAISVAALTKVTALPVALVGGIALLVAGGPGGLRSRAIGVAAAAPGGLWWLRNLVVDGRLTPGGTELFDATGPPTAATDGVATYALENVGLLLHRSLGLYGWAQRLVPDWVAWGALVLAAALAVGWLAVGGRRWPPGRGLLLVAAPLLGLATTLSSSYGNHQRTGAVTGLAGRYLYPAAPLVWVAVAAAAAAVLGRVAPAVGHRVAPLAGALGLVAGVASLAYCLTGLYATVGIRTLVSRMELVAPLTAAGPIVAALTLATVGATVQAVRASALVLPADGTR